MPLLQLHLAGTWPAATQAALQAGLTRLMAEVLGKRANLTVVAVQQTPATQWSGGALAGRGLVRQPGGTRDGQHQHDG